MCRLIKSIDGANVEMIKLSSMMIGAVFDNTVFLNPFYTFVVLQKKFFNLISEAVA